jgi:hypothetical protein
VKKLAIARAMRRTDRIKVLGRWESDVCEAASSNKQDRPADFIGSAGLFVFLVFLR